MTRTVEIGQLIGGGVLVGKWMWGGKRIRLRRELPAIYTIINIGGRAHKHRLYTPRRTSHTRGTPAATY